MTRTKHNVHRVASLRSVEGDRAAVTLLVRHLVSFSHCGASLDSVSILICSDASTVSSYIKLIQFFSHNSSFLPPPGPLCVVLEYAENGSLLEHLRQGRNDVGLLNKDKFRLALGVAKGMNHLSSMQVHSAN